MGRGFDPFPQQSQAKGEHKTMVSLRLQIQRLQQGELEDVADITAKNMTDCTRHHDGCESDFVALMDDFEETWWPF